jgi:hypothetical protein
MNIAIVDMIDQNYKKSVNKTPVSECIDPLIIRNETIPSNESSAIIVRKSSLERKLMIALKVRNPKCAKLKS